VELKGGAEPVWGGCRTKRQLAFLARGAWGALGWALLEATAAEAQVLDGLAVELLPGGSFLVSFELPAADLEHGVGSAGFLVSTVDNCIVTGPHSVGDLREAR